MGIEVNYRTSTTKKEIIEALIAIQVDLIPLLIWQNEGGERFVTNVKIESIDYAGESIFLSPFSNEDEMFFNKLKINSTIYLRGNNKNIVFKQEKAANKTSKGLLQIFIPNEVKMFEKRKEVRQNFAGKDPKVTAEIYPGGRKDITTRSIIIDVKDVSLSGMGFYLAKKHARLFFEKDKIKILRIGNNGFPRPIIAEIMNIGAGAGNVDSIRLGVRFSERITQEIIDRI